MRRPARSGLDQAITLALGQTYTVNLTGTDSSGTGAIIIVDIVVAEAPYHRYDLNRNGSIEKDEVLAAVSNYFAGLIEKDDVLDVSRRSTLRVDGDGRPNAGRK